MPHRLLGISLTILSMFWFATTYAFYKASEPFLSSGQILCFSNFFSWLLILPFVCKMGTKELATHHFPMIALRTLLGVGSIYGISLALATVSLSEVLLLNNTAPFFVPFIVWIFYKTKIPHSLWVGLVIGFIGIFIVLRPGFTEIRSGQIFGLCSGIAAAAMLVAVRQIAHEPFLRIMFYYFLIFAAVMSPSLFSAWTFPPATIWLYLVLAGTSMICAQISLTGAMRYAAAHDAAPFLYTSVIFAGLIDWIVWKNKPGMISIVGMIIVCIGGIITMLKGTAKKA